MSVSRAVRLLVSIVVLVAAPGPILAGKAQGPSPTGSQRGGVVGRTGGAPSKQGSTMVRPSSVTPLPFIVGMDVSRIRARGMKVMVKSLVRALSKELLWPKVKQTCGLHFVSRVERIEIAARDVHAKTREMALAVKGSFGSAQVLACYKRLMGLQQPQPMKIAGVSGLMVTMPSGRSRVILMVGPHTLVWADPVSASWAISGDLWKVSPSLMALRGSIPRRALLWMALGHVPFDRRPWSGSALRGVRGIEGLVMNVVPARRRRSRARWVLGGTVRLATGRDASKLLSVLKMGQAVLQGTSKGGRGSPAKAGDAVKQLFVLATLSRTGRELRLTAPLKDSLAKVMMQVLLAKLSVFP